MTHFYTAGHPLVDRCGDRPLHRIGDRPPPGGDRPLVVFAGVAPPGGMGWWWRVVWAGVALSVGMPIGGGSLLGDVGVTGGGQDYGAWLDETATVLAELDLWAEADAAAIVAGGTADGLPDDERLPLLADPAAAGWSLWHWDARATLTQGWTDNVLRGRVPLASAYSGVEVESGLFGFPFGRSQLVVFGWLEWRRYRAPLPVKTEMTALGYGRWDLPLAGGWLVPGLELQYYYGDQFYDASTGLVGSQPQGALLRQQVPGGRALLVMRPSERLSVDWSVRGARVRMADPRDNFESVGGGLDVKWQPTPRHELKLSGHYTVEDYVGQRALRPTGLGFDGRLLEMQRTTVAAAWIWRALWLGGGTLTVDGQYGFHRDNGGDYHDVDRWRVGLALDMRWRGWRGRTHVDWQQADYGARLISFIDGRLVRESRQTLGLALSRQFGHNYELTVQYELQQFRSRQTANSYTRHGLELAVSRGF
jgi:hypothetical protein